jgi:hypothetical protein
VKKPPAAATSHLEQSVLGFPGKAGADRNGLALSPSATLALPKRIETACRLLLRTAPAEPPRYGPLVLYQGATLVVP